MDKKEFKVFVNELKIQREKMNKELDHFGAGDIQIIVLNNINHHIDELIATYERDVIPKYHDEKN